MKLNTYKCIEKLKVKKAAMIQENCKYDGYNRLCRTRWYGHQRKVAMNYKKMSAIEMAIKILNMEIVEISDIEKLYIDCFPECDKNIKLSNNFLSSCPNLEMLFWVIENSLQKYLPVHKREVFKLPVFLKYADRVMNINKKIEYMSGSIAIMNYSFPEYLKQIKSMHHTFFNNSQKEYESNMKSILLSCCFRFNLKPNKWYFEMLQDAAIRNIIHNDLKPLIENYNNENRKVLHESILEQK